MDDAASPRVGRAGSDLPWRLGLLALGLIAGGVVGLLLGLFIGDFWRAFGESRYRAIETHGRVEIPPGVSPDSLRILASREGRFVGMCTPEADGSFVVSVGPEGPFDLHVSDWETWREPYPRDGSPPEPAPTHAVEGLLRRVGWGAQGIRVELVTRPLADVTIRVRGPDGAPAAKAWVHLSSFDDSVSAKADEQGLAHFTGLPARPWQAVAGLGARPLESLQAGQLELVPAGQELELDIPRGVRVHVRLAHGLTANLLSGGGTLRSAAEVYLAVPWEPGPEGTMTLLVAPDLPTLALKATYKRQIDERTTSESPVAAGAIAVREGATLVLEPLERD